MVLITKSNLFSGPWTNVFSLVNNRSNVADPLRSSSEFRKFVYSREPDVKSSDFKGYPFIVVNGASMTFDDKRSVNMKSAFVNWAMEIEIVSTDRGLNEEEGKGLSYMDSISDDVAETFNDVTNRKSLKAQRISFVDPNAGNVSTEPSRNELVFRRSFILTFKTRMQVSS